MSQYIAIPFSLLVRKDDILYQKTVRLQKVVLLKIALIIIRIEYFLNLTLPDEGIKGKAHRYEIFVLINRKSVTVALICKVLRDRILF